MAAAEDWAAIKVCLCGCERAVPGQTPGQGRPRLYARKNCGRVVNAARLAGWTEAEELTPRAFLVAARQAAREAYVNLPQNAKRAFLKDEPLDGAVAFVNPRVCECGCGRPARFASSACARKARP